MDFMLVFRVYHTFKMAVVIAIPLCTLIHSFSFVFLCASISLVHRDEMKSLQAALQKQLDDAAERAEKQQATVRPFTLMC